jgi:hypothetical protein
MNLARLRVDVFDELGLGRCFQRSSAVLPLDFARPEQAAAYGQNGQQNEDSTETVEEVHEKYASA